MRATVIALLLLAGGMAPVTAQQQEGNEEGKRTIVAVVENVDVLGRTVTVLDTWGKATEFSLGNGARIAVTRDSVEELATIDDLKPGQRVQVSFTGTDGKPENVRVTILPAQDYRRAP